MGNGLFGLAVLFTFIYLLWRFIKKTFSPSPKSRTVTSLDYHQEVVGEASYLKNLQTIVGTTGTEIRIDNVDAMLVPEPSNEYDKNAVRVEINGLLVGYLPKFAAKSHVKSGRGIESCKAMITGGGPNKPNYGVWLCYK